MAIKDAIAVLGDIGKQGATLWAADQASKTAAATRAAAQQQWVAEQQADVYKTMYESSDKLLSDLSNKVFTGEFDISDTEGTNYGIYKQQWSRRTDAFKQWANALGLPTYDSETDIIALVDAMFEETINTTDNPKKYLKFGDTKGKWAELVSRISPGVDLDLVEIVWNNRYDALTGEGGRGTGAEGLPAGVEDSWAVFTPEEMGKLPWWLEKGANWWMGQTQKALEDRARAGDVLYKGLGIDRLLETGAERAIRLGEREAPPERLDLSQYEEAAQRRDSANNLLAGIANTLISPATADGPSAYDRTGQAAVIARRGAQDVESVFGRQGMINGFLAQDTEEEDELPPLSRASMNFMQRLALMIEEYGPEQAFKLMSREFKELPKSDKAKIEEYLRSR
jgi:hypothetical protein